MSWTLDRRRAEWFARRFSGEEMGTALLRLTWTVHQHEDPAVVAMGSIARDDVIAYRAARGEKEIVALPESVAIVSIDEL